MNLLKTAFYSRWKIRKLLLAFVFSIQILHAQNKYTVSGYVSDIATGEMLIGANVYDSEIFKGTSTNVYGFFSITLPKGDYKLVSSYVGYQSDEVLLNLKADTVINFRLVQSTSLKEIQIRGQQSVVNSTQMSKISVPVESIETLPSFFGEADPIKVLTLLPGVQGGTEGTSGFYVRGGGPDENLVLLDGVPLYNVDHLFGFFSVFNPDAIKSVELYKGGFPSRYGERLSSILDIRMKDGNDKKIHGKASIGLISSKLFLEGPLWKEKTTFMLSARRTYIDVLLRPYIQSQMDGGVAGYYFYDLNGKITHKFNEKSKIYLSAYLGDDQAYLSNKYKYDSGSVENPETYESSTDFNLGWGNLIGSLRWNYKLSPKLFSNTTVTYSRYNFGINIGMDEKNTIRNNGSNSVMAESSFDLGLNSNIEDIGLNLDFDYYHSTNQNIKFGIKTTNHTFRPNVFTFHGEYGDSTSSVALIDTTINNSNRTFEAAVFFEDEITIADNFKANVGLRLSSYKTNETWYYNLQPRISTFFRASDNFSLKGSYSRMAQYVHLLSNSTISLPTDLWVPVTKNIKPMVSDQVALGFAWNLFPGIDFSVESYYKTMQNVIDYKNGASFFGATESWEEKVVVGNGVAYGAEFLLEKKSGKTTGWIGYTLSKSERQFEELNFGKPFPYTYDRRHDFKAAINHNFTDKFDVGFVFVYNTGRAVTLAKQDYYRPSLPLSDLDGIYFNSIYKNQDYIDQRNNFRFPYYLRTDVSLNYHFRKKNTFHTISLSVYNATNRMNPFFLDFETDSYLNTTTGKYETRKKLYQYSLFPILPTLNYSIKF